MNFLIVALFATAITISAASNYGITGRCGSKTPLRFNPTTLFPTRNLGYSQISLDRHTGIATIAGQTAIQENGTVLGDSVAEQFNSVANNVKLALSAIGAPTFSVTNMLITIVDFNNTEHLSLVVAIGKKFGNPPNTLIGVSRLAFPSLLVEVEASTSISREFDNFVSFCKCDGHFVDPTCGYL
eukprot:IDg7685t1